MWYTSITGPASADSGDPEFWQSICYATSTDGISWNRATRSPGPQNQIFPIGYGMDNVIYNPANATGQKFIMAVYTVNGVEGRYLYGSEDGITGWTLLKTLTGVDISSVTQRGDGHWMVYHITSTTPGRCQGVLISDSTDVTGTYTDTVILPTLTSADLMHQYYEIWTYPYNGVWLGFVSRFHNDPAQNTDPNFDCMDIDLWQSSDNGITWTQVCANWIKRESWYGAVIFECWPVQVGSEWRVYFTGTQAKHVGLPRNENIGYVLPSDLAVNPFAILTANPAQVTANGKYILQLSSTQAIWTQATPSAIFTMAGISDATLGTPTVISDTLATAVLYSGNPGTLPATLTITDTTTTQIVTVKVTNAFWPIH
jgi:hypothetical protein